MVEDFDAGPGQHSDAGPADGTGPVSGCKPAFRHHEPDNWAVAQPLMDEAPGECLTWPVPGDDADYPSESGVADLDGIAFMSVTGIRNERDELSRGEVGAVEGSLVMVRISYREQHGVAGFGLALVVEKVDLLKGDGVVNCAILSGLLAVACSGMPYHRDRCCWSFR